MAYVMQRVLLALPSVAVDVYWMNTATLHWSSVSAAHDAWHDDAVHDTLKPAVPGARMLEICKDARAGWGETR